MASLLGHPAVLVQAVLVALLAYVIVDDLRHFRVRNDVVLLIAALFALFWAIQRDLWFGVPHLLFGAVMFLVFLFLYARGWMGGGDVKLLAVAFLWLGPERAMPFAIALGVFAALYGTLAQFYLVPVKDMPGGRRKVPYAPSIALAWIVALLLPTF